MRGDFVALWTNIYIINILLVIKEWNGIHETVMFGRES